MKIIRKLLNLFKQFDRLTSNNKMLKHLKALSLETLFHSIFLILK